MIFEPSQIHELAPAGRLRASLNMANAVLAHSKTAASKPAGVTIDLAQELARRLGLEVEFLQWGAPGDSVQAIASGRADIGFLAVDPKRAELIYFTAPYVQIEGCYLVRDNSPLRHAAEVDRSGTRIIVLDTSAYDLYLTRNLKNAQLVRVPDALRARDALLSSKGICLVAGVKQALLQDIASMRGVHLLKGSFMDILQCIALPQSLSARTKYLVEEFLKEMFTSGFVQDSLVRHGMDGVTVLNGGLSNSGMAEKKSAH